MSNQRGTSETDEDLARMALELTEARRRSRLLSAPTTDLTPEDGYRVQSLMEITFLEQGDRVSGYKIGLTTAAAQATRGATEPGYGRLFASSLCAEEVRRAPSENLLYEVELALVIARDLELGEVIPRIDVPWIRKAGVAIEIVSSRWRDHAGIGSWIADNAMAHSAVLPQKWVEPKSIPTLLHAHTNRPPIDDPGSSTTGSTHLTQVLENLNWLTTALAREGRRLRTGDIVLTGAIIGPVSLPATANVRLQAWIRDCGSLDTSVKLK